MILLQKLPNSVQISSQPQISFFKKKKNINQAKIASSNSKQEFKKHLLETLSQLSDDEDEDKGESVLPGYSQDPYDDIEL